MKLLLDTHIVLWWLRDNPRLGSRARVLIADPRAELMVSVASFWELSIKARIGKMEELGSVLLDEARAGGFEVVDVRRSHLVALEELELASDHKDPFDRLILAQAIAEEAMLVTADVRLLAYPVRAFRAK